MREGRELRAAYSDAAGAWATGPARIYDRMAELLVGRSPIRLQGALVADVGSGRGAASRALRTAGARPLAIDVAEGMLQAEQGPWRLAADARALPLRSSSLDGVVAAFSFNHLPDPVAALREAIRVTRSGGAVLASAYALDDDHPVKAAVDDAASGAGWSPQPWMAEVRSEAIPLLATPARATEVAHEAGLQEVDVEVIAELFPGLTPRELVAWRLGMATMAPFVASLAPAAQQALLDDALERLGADPPVLERRMVVMAMRAP
jgi:ubiquinone/menaquinone biosynthesis C-methylase UbiE